MLTPLSSVLFAITLVSSVAISMSFGSSEHNLPQPPADYESLRAQAEAYIEEGSYRRAMDLYLQADQFDLSQDEARWVQFRIADTMWRNDAATQTYDNTIAERAREKLNDVIKSYDSKADRDALWVATQESLGDYWWQRQNSQNFHQGWQHYAQVLDFWAGSRDLNKARENYLRILFDVAEPSWIGNNYYYRQYVQIPADVLQNAVDIATEESDRVHAEYLLAMSLRQQGDFRKQLRVEELFKSVIEAGKQSEWYDDALYFYGEWLSQQGRPTRQGDGTWQYQHDYKQAVALFRQVTTEFRKGATPYYDNAKQYIEQITSPALSANVSNIFLPDSDVMFYLGWRNVDSIEIDLYKVDLTSDVKFQDRTGANQNWIDALTLNKNQIIKQWTIDTEDDGNHLPHSHEEQLEDELAPGAYIVVAKSGKLTSRDIILISDATIVAKSIADKAVIFAADAINGSPIADATVTVWENRWDSDGTGSSRWQARSQSGTTDERGLVEFDLQLPRDHGSLFFAMKSGDKQAFSTNSVSSKHSPGRDYRIYAVTDRPAYKPGDEVNWKMTARLLVDSTYTTPADHGIKYEIFDPRGTSVKEGEFKLNQFGSAWDAFELGSDLALGSYRVQFRTKKDNDYIGEAELFRMEEYKLPEYEVTIKPAVNENGNSGVYQLGDTVSVDVTGTYFFGGSVAGAEVEIIVYKKPFYNTWQQPRDYPWLYEDSNSYGYEYGGRSRYGYQPREQVMRETLKTDETGTAKLTIETPITSNDNLEYTIEARMVDASRREVSAANTIRVTHQKYFVHAYTDHKIFKPNSAITVNFEAKNANQNAVEATGLVEVFRDEWIEIWVSPDGKEVTGDELAALKNATKVWPPQSAAPGQIGWRLKFKGYKSEKVTSQQLTTDDQGKVEFEFTPEVAGYYRITWLSEKLAMYPVTAQTMVWVCDDTSKAIGYYNAGVQVILDKDTIKPGQTAPVMISVPTNNRHVFLTVEGNQLHHYDMVHVTESVKLVQLEITDAFLPNVWLNATMVENGQLLVDQQQLIVPPVSHFLETEVSMNQDDFEPGETGTVSVITRDHDGNPVSAEVTLSIVDEAVYAIQSELAGDPRKFFFNNRQHQFVRTTSSFSQKQYKQVKVNEEGNIVYRDGREMREELGRTRNDLGLGAGMARGMMDEMAVMEDSAGAPPPSGAPMARRSMAAKSEMSRGRSRSLDQDFEEGEAQPQDLGNVRVRSDFRDTAIWLPDLITGEDGRASAEVSFPDSTSRWNVQARSATTNAAFGIASAKARTRQPLIVRVQAPRFMTVKDETVISAVINNNTLEPMQTTVEGRLDGLNVLAVEMDGNSKPTDQPFVINIPAEGSARVDWSVAVESPGEALVIVRAAAGKHSDGMEKRYTKHAHGIEKHLIQSGKATDDDVTIAIDLPAERSEGTTHMHVQITPSLAVTMLDSLPYLIDYPYGCTEQTMSRFLPATIVAKTLEDLGLDPAIAMNRAFGGIEQEHIEKTQPKGKQDLAELDAITEESLKRLADFQQGDGGWGWWKTSSSDNYMTAYVVWGLALAEDAGIELPDNMLSRGVTFLQKNLVEEENRIDNQAWMLHALAVATDGRNGDPSKFERTAIDNLWQNKDRLNAFARALFALAVHEYGDDEKATVLVRNLENGVKLDESPDTSIVMNAAQETQPTVMKTAHWGADGIYYRWSQGPVETTSFVLKALLKIQPDHELVEPTANWLLKNRRGAQWSNTRDTAIAVLTFTDYIKATGELENSVEFEVIVNGNSVATTTLAKEDLLAAPSVFEIDPTLLKSGKNNVRIIRRDGKSPLYFSVDAEFFSKEEPITAAGHEIFVRREYYKLVPYPTLLKGYEFDRVPLVDGGSVKSGERVEVVLIIESKNDYEYLLFEDLKPAGLEAVQVKSGGPIYARELKLAGIERRLDDDAEVGENLSRDQRDYTNRRAGVYQELRTRHVAMFIDRLPQGVWELSYEMRAEVPGEFHALPLMGHAMYVPEIRANSNEIRMTVYDRDE